MRTQAMSVRKMSMVRWPEEYVTTVLPFELYNNAMIAARMVQTADNKTREKNVHASASMRNN